MYLFVQCWRLECSERRLAGVGKERDGIVIVGTAFERMEGLKRPRRLRMGPTFLLLSWNFITVSGECTKFYGRGLTLGRLNGLFGKGGVGAVVAICRAVCVGAVTMWIV